MKKLGLLCFSFLSIHFVIAQKADTTIKGRMEPAHQMYLEKAKANKTTGFVMLGSGVGLAGVGFYLYLMHELRGDTGARTEAGPAIILLGTVAALGSIPFFIRAHSNKTQAALALSEESFRIGSEILPNSNYTALAFRIQLSTARKNFNVTSAKKIVF